MEIRDASGKRRKLLIDQSVNGARWNSLGCFDLAAGAQEIIASNEGPTDCDNYWIAATGAPLQMNCYWIADAFRLEWIGASCDSAMSGMNPQATCAISRAVRTTGQPTVISSSRAEADWATALATPCQAIEAERRCNSMVLDGRSGCLSPADRKRDRACAARSPRSTIAPSTSTTPSERRSMPLHRSHTPRVMHSVRVHHPC